MACESIGKGFSYTGGMWKRTYVLLNFSEYGFEEAKNIQQKESIHWRETWNHDYIDGIAQFFEKTKLSKNRNFMENISVPGKALLFPESHKIFVTCTCQETVFESKWILTW